jgi:hypothetical protein
LIVKDISICINLYFFGLLVATDYSASTSSNRRSFGFTGFRLDPLTPVAFVRKFLKSSSYTSTVTSTLASTPFATLVKAIGSIVQSSSYTSTPIAPVSKIFKPRCHSATLLPTSIKTIGNAFKSSSHSLTGTSSPTHAESTSHFAISALHSTLASLVKSAFGSLSGVPNSIDDPPSNAPTAATSVAVCDLATVTGAGWAAVSTVSARKIWIKHSACALQVVGDRRMVLVVSKSQCLVLNNGTPLIWRLLADWGISNLDQGVNI